MRVPQSRLNGGSVYNCIYVCFGTRCSLVPIPGDGFCFYRALAQGLVTMVWKSLKRMIGEAVRQTEILGKLISKRDVSSPIELDCIGNLRSKIVTHNERNPHCWPDQLRCHYGQCTCS